MTFRLSSISPSDSRKSDSLETKRKLYIAAEGISELYYFESFNEVYSSKLIIDIQSLERIDHSLSNPKTIVRMLENFISCSKTLTDDERKGIQAIIKDVDDEVEINYDSHKDALKGILGEDRFKLLDSKKSKDLASYQLLLDISYMQENDSIAIIVDRDQHSFSEEQFDFVEEVCRRNDYLLGITNPCFELYLLLHLNDVATFNLDEIKKNKKSGEDTYMTSCLKSSLQGSACANKNYEKNHYDSQFFVSLYANAKDNFEKSNLKSDIQELKENVGTTIFSVLDKFCNEEKF